MEKEKTKENQGPELVIGVIGALGSNITFVIETLKKALGGVNYDYRIIHLAKLLHEFDAWSGLPESPLDEYIEKHQDAGDSLRKKTKTNDALARLAVVRIRAERGKVSDESKPISRCAYILRSLKRPEEVNLLRRIYGSGFFLVAAYSPRENRVDNLSEAIARSHHQSADPFKYREHAEKLLNRDEADPDVDHGQNVQKAFPQADVFVDVSDRDSAENSIYRFIDLVFQHPFHTPSRDEYAMFHAKAAALRSSDLSRQVGAVILSSSADILAVGTNEVPKAGGGLYWSDDEYDYRDFSLNRDTTNEMRKEALGEILSKLQEDGLLSKEMQELSHDELLNEVVPRVKSTQVMGSGEYGRTVHAEMAAITDAARRGVSIESALLYTTTFPCHNCAKHIVASGIKKVVYIEPYPKSRAFQLHHDSIASELPERGSTKLIFCPFVGIAPRRYIELFSMVDRKSGDVLVDWDSMKSIVSPRIPDNLSYFRYLEVEKQVLIALDKSLEESGLL